MKSIAHTMMWRRFDLPGLDAAYYGSTSTGWRLCGTAIFGSEAGPCHLGYAVDADDRWLVRAAHVFGTVGPELIDLHIGASTDRAWTVDGRVQPEAGGCLDLDLGFTTAARMFTLRRLALVDRQEGVAPVARLRLPDAALDAVTESYVRLHGGAFRFSTAAADTLTVLSVDPHLAVLRYPGRWDSAAFPAIDAHVPPALARPGPDLQNASPANTEAMRVADAGSVRR